MIIEIFVCHPDGTQELRKREVSDDWFPPQVNFPTLEPPSNEQLAKQLAALSEQLAQSDEAAISSFEAQAATDEVIIALYEKIGG